jgi:hypothetical protein
MGVRGNLGWKMGSRPPPPLQDLCINKRVVTCVPFYAYITRIETIVVNAAVA